MVHHSIPVKHIISQYKEQISSLIEAAKLDAATTEKSLNLAEENLAVQKSAKEIAMGVARKQDRCDRKTDELIKKVDILLSLQPRESP